MSNVIMFNAPKKEKRKNKPRAKPPKVSKHMRFDQEKFGMLEELADLNDMSVAEFVRCIVNQAIEQRLQVA
ncbi:hypothetical protein [Pseudoxanthomonas winnipegensis]|uniref:CopG family transcriptional regulator n=1 Tax=Pseudoxanthomonas winnipegensis TaxID=2480810 RepID=A0A4Q8M3K6_9GAMM|nr:hypothetical protein [Pseudoxanthomonas winnipegensis]TAA41582.1 hypothetical protein EA655_11620 [Pseudoxanthomonas winnipegensis]